MFFDHYIYCIAEFYVIKNCITKDLYKFMNRSFVMMNLGEVGSNINKQPASAKGLHRLYV